MSLSFICNWVIVCGPAFGGLADDLGLRFIPGKMILPAMLVRVEQGYLLSRQRVSRLGAVSFVGITTATSVWFGNVEIGDWPAAQSRQGQGLGPLKDGSVVVGQ